MTVVVGDGEARGPHHDVCFIHAVRPFSELILGPVWPGRSHGIRRDGISFKVMMVVSVDCVKDPWIAYIPDKFTGSVWHAVHIPGFYLPIHPIKDRINFKVFSDLLTASGSLKTFEDSLDGGLTVFCPGDDATKKFMPKYKNLTAEGKASLLLFHGVPVYQSIAMLKSNNGLMNTLATDGVKKFDFTVQNNGEEVTLQTKIVTAKITGTVVDEEPLAVYTLDKVLEPKELFKKVEVPAPAPAPEKPSPAPKGKGKKLSPPAPEGPDLAPSDDQKAADDDSGSVRFNGGWAMVVGLGVMLLI